MLCFYILYRVTSREKGQCVHAYIHRHSRGFEERASLEMFDSTAVAVNTKHDLTSLLSEVIQTWSNRLY